MRYLITGGYGALGFYLACRLRQEEHDVAILDKYDGWIFNEEFTTPSIQESFDAGSLQRAFIKFKPDVVFHCAEETIPDPSLAEHMMHSNLTFTTTVLRTCAAREVRCVVPAWFDIDGTHPDKSADPVIDIWKKTVEWRASIIENFNKGNAINNVVWLPRVLGPHFNINTFGNVVKRVYSAAVTTGNAQFWKGEFRRYNNKEWWGSVDDVVTELIQISQIRTRNEYEIQKKYLIPTTDLLNQTIFLASGLDEVEVFTERQEPRTFINVDCSDSRFLTPILATLEGTINVWRCQ